VSRLAERMAGIRPFHVMALLERARALEASGRSVVHMEIGEPDFPAPPPVTAAGVAALQSHRTFYSPAAGLPALREAIAAGYAPEARPGPEQVVVTPGSSGALNLVFGVLLDPGDEVLMADPGYPCNRHFVRLFNGRAVLVPVGPESAYQLTAEAVRRNWSASTRAVMVASPSNPTGTLIEDDELARIVETVAALGGVLIVDEIYHGLVYSGTVRSVLHHSDAAFVVNSFSKYYGMTGWRVGWLVAPKDYVDAVVRLAQNIFISASTPAQHAALAALSPEAIAEFDRRREVFRRRRDFLLPALEGLGFRIPVRPGGAFYIYAECSAHTDDSFAFAWDLLETTGVAVTPGLDFGDNAPERHLRFSYANAIENLEEGVRRIAGYLGRG
jgi:aspartate/methionine/tyrosine aminotransferase